MLRRLGLGLLLGMAVGNSAWAQGATRFDGQYTGELTLTRQIDGDCTEPPAGAQYPLMISGGQVKFTYAPRFATTLTGTINESGAFKASAPLKKGSVQMTGNIRGHSVAASIVSPSCGYTFQGKN